MPKIRKTAPVGRRIQVNKTNDAMLSAAEDKLRDLRTEFKMKLSIR